MNKLDSKKFNLSENEMKIYMCLLNDGPKTVIELSGILNISRSGLYKIIEKLIENKFIQKKDNTLFPLSPEILYKRLSEEEESIRNQKNLVEHLIELSKKPIVKVFFGNKGLAELSNELRKSPSNKGYIVVNSDYLPKELRSRRSKEKFTDNVVINFTKNKKKKGRQKEIQLTYAEQKDFSSISIFDDRVAFSSGSGMKYSGLLIVDKNIANLLKDLINNLL